MANRPGSATITMDVEGAESSRRRIETVGDALREMDRTSLRGINGQIGSITDGFSALKGTIGAAMGALAAAGVATAFGGWIKGAVDATDAASDLSQKTGIAIKDLAGLELAFQKGGMEAGDLESTMAKLSNKVVAGSAAFEKLGVGTKQLDGSLKSNKEMLYGLADQFATMEDGVQKAAIAQEIFGKSGAAMIPMLNEGSKGLREMDEMAHKLGLSLSDEAVEQAGNFNDTLDLLALGGKGVARGIAAELLPTLSSLAGQFLATMTKGDALKNTAHYLATGLKVLYTAGVAVVEVFSTVGKTVGAAGAQLVSLLQGNFSQAAQIGRMWQEDIGNSWSATLGSLEAAWNASGDASVDAMVKAMQSGKKMNATSAEIAEQAKKAAKAQEEEARLLAELSGLSGTFATQWDQLSRAYGRGKLSLDGLTKAQADLLAQQPGIKAAADQELKYRNELAEAAKGYAAAYQFASDAKAKAFAEIQAQRDEVEQIGLSAVALADLNAERLESRALRAEENAEIAEGLDLTGAMAQLYRDEAAALRELAKEQRKGARTKIASDEAKSIADDWKRTTQDMEKSLTDALLRGFESGKGFADNLAATVKNMFNTMVLRPVIQGVMAPVTGVMAGSLGMAGTAQAASGSTASAMNSMSTLGGMAGLFGAGGLSGAVTAGAGWMTGATTLTGSLTAAGSLAATGTLGGIASSLGMAVGALGPIALGIGAVAALASKAFGRGPKEFSDQQTLNGMLGAGGFSGTMDAEWVKKGGWFSSDKRGVDKNSVGAEFSGSLTAAYSAITKSSAEFAQVLGINADSIASRTQEIKIAMGKDEAANQKAITEFFVDVGNSIAGELLPEIAKFQAQGEAASATLQRLAAGYSTIEQSLWSIGMSFNTVGTASLEARERLLAAAGGLDAFAANTAGFQQNFLSEAERNAPVLKMVAEQMAALGLSAVDTREEFKQTVFGLDLATEAGAKQYGALMQLQAAFAQVYPAIDKVAIGADKSTAALQQRNALQDEYDNLTMTSTQLLAKQRDALDESNRALFDQIQGIKAQAIATQAAKDRGDNLLAGVDSAFSALQNVVGREKALIQETADAHRSLATALHSTLDSMSVPGQEREQRLGAKAQIQAALAIAKAGGVLPDADSLKGALSVLSKDASSMFATQQDYLRDFYSTQNDIAALAGLTDDALSVEEKSLKSLDGILDNAQQQVDALKGIDSSVLSLAEAMRGFNVTMGAAKADPVASAAGSIAEIYRELLGRSADSAGLDYWQNAVAGGMSLDQVRKMIMEGAEYKGIPGFASGGMFGGGLRIVGENGPELEATGPARIWSASQTSALLSGAGGDSGGAAMAAELKALRTEVQGLRAETRATASHTEKSARLLDRIERHAELQAEVLDRATAGGGPMTVTFEGMPQPVRVIA